MSQDGFMDTLVKFNSQTVGRDRVIRLLQYGSKLLAWTLKKAEINKEFATKFQNLEYSLSTGRKCFVELMWPGLEAAKARSPERTKLVMATWALRQYSEIEPLLVQFRPHQLDEA